MKLINQITIYQNNQKKFIQLFHGDLTEIPPEHSVDILVISAFPDDYYPTRGTLIGALKEKGISVDNLAKDKSVDLRDNFSCWLSKEIHGRSFKRILCFEPLVRGNASEVVGDIFQSLMPFVFSDPPIKNIALPLVACGNQREPIGSLFEPMVDAAANWLMLGLPVNTIKIVEISETKINIISKTFEILKNKYEQHQVGKQNKYKYDLFISYSHQNKVDIQFVIDQLIILKPDIKIFIDNTQLNTGSAWQQSLFEALDECRMVVAFLSEPYINSKICKEEFNIAVFRHRNAEEPVLMPIYLNSTNLPSYMQLIQFFDCRESDKAKLSVACAKIIESFNEKTDNGIRCNEKTPQYCPICKQEVQKLTEYPDYVCKKCCKVLTDINKSKIYYQYEDVLKGYYSDSGLPYNDITCYAHDIKCFASELPCGGIIIRKSNANK